MRHYTWRVSAALSLLLGVVSPAKADLITYSWNDDFTSSAFYGQFTADTSKMADGPGGKKWLTAQSIVSSSFVEGRFGFIVFQPGQTPFQFQVSGISSGSNPGIAIDASTGAVLSTGSILFGTSNVVNIPGIGNLQLTSSAADFNTQYATPYQESWGYSYTLVGSNNDPPGTIGSIGQWDVHVDHVATPEPATLALLPIGAGLVLGYAWRRRKRLRP
jgi:hypothetical protein